MGVRTLCRSFEAKNAKRKIKKNRISGHGLNEFGHV